MQTSVLGEVGCIDRAFVPNTMTLAAATFFGLRADAWGALAAWAGAVATVGLIYFAYRQIRNAAEAQTQQSRPFITPDFDGRSVIVYLSFKNLGRTVARNVVVTLDHPFTESGGQDASWQRSALFTTGLPTFPPGKDVRFFFDSFPDRVKERLPMEFGMAVRYTDFAGREYSERYVLDLGALGEVLQSDLTMHELVEETRKTREALEKWMKGQSSPIVRTVDSDLQSRRQSRPAWFALAAQAREKDGNVAWLRYWIKLWRRRYGIRKR